jgi:hypothetical protein
MPVLYWQSTQREDRSLTESRAGTRAYLLSHGRLHDVQRRRERGRELAAALRQFDDDDIDIDDLREIIEDASLNRSRINGRLGALIQRHFSICDDCDSLQSPDHCETADGRTICESCLDSYYRCEHCDCLAHGDAITCINDAAICDCCRDENYYYWESDGEWHSEPERSDLIYPYNVTMTGPLGTLPTDRRASHVLGAELELEVDDPSEFAESLDSEHSTDQCHCKHDGSLSDEHGVEVVTGHGTFADLTSILESVATIARQHGGKSHEGDGCGLHIGLDRSQFSTLLQAKIIVFWNAKANYDFLRQFTRRDYRTNGYCKAKPEKATREFLDSPDLAAGDKYEIVNTCHRSHLEFRAFRGSLIPRTLRACVALVSAIASYCDQANPEPRDLTSAAFCRWLQSVDDERSKAITAYLEHRKTCA